MSWLQLSSSCPCCRAPVPPSKPYRYPAKTKLQNPLLRARVEGIGLNMREVALLTTHLESPAVFVCVVSHAAPLAPVPLWPRTGRRAILHPRLRESGSASWLMVMTNRWQAAKPSCLVTKSSKISIYRQVHSAGVEEKQALGEAQVRVIKVVIRFRSD